MAASLGGSVAIKGMRVLERRLEKLEKIARREGRRDTERILTEAAQPVVEAARERAPRRAGRATRGRRHLETTIRAVIHRRARFPTVKVGFGKKQCHGIFFELGTTKMPARPFLRPALDEKQGEAVAIGRRLLRERVLEVTRGR